MRFTSNGSNMVELANRNRTDRRIGLLAGWGRFPIVVAETLKRQGYYIACLGLHGHTSDALKGLCDDYREVGVGKLGAAIRYFRKQSVAQATMAGKFRKVELYQPWAWFRHLPDLRAIRTFYPHFVATKKDRKDDTLLGAVVDAFAEDGIHFAPATDFAPELLVKPGCLTDRQPTATQWKDIEFGWTLAKEMGRLDVGQSVAVKDRAVMAVEAIEGTDECIRRAGQLCKSGGFTVVKVSKPQQDMRFDVPTIGMGTMESMTEAGGKVLAVEAGKTIIVDETAVLSFANRHKIAIVSLGVDGRLEA
jgi:DUF1009 family protein